MLLESGGYDDITSCVKYRQQTKVNQKYRENCLIRIDRCDAGVNIKSARALPLVLWIVCIIKMVIKHIHKQKIKIISTLETLKETKFYAICKICSNEMITLLTIV